MSKDIIDRMREIRKQIDNEPRVVTVSKLGQNDDDLLIYVWPVTTQDYQKILREKDPVDSSITTILLRAKTADGERMFQAAERGEIVKLFGPKLILKLASEINKDFNFDDETGIDIMGN